MPSPASAPKPASQTRSGTISAGFMSRTGNTDKTSTTASSTINPLLHFSANMEHSFRTGFQKKKNFHSFRKNNLFLQARI